MSLFSRFYGRFDRWESHDSSGYEFMVCSSKDNSYIPIYSVKGYLKISDSNDIIYELKIPVELTINEITSKDVMKVVTDGKKLRKISYGDTTYYIKKGLIFTVNSSSIIQILFIALVNINNIQEHFTDVKVLIDSEVFTNTQHSRIRHYISKNLVSESIARHKDVTITTNILDKYFKPAYYKAKFSTLEEVEEKLIVNKTLVSNLNVARPLQLPEVVGEENETTQETRDDISHHQTEYPMTPDEAFEEVGEFLTLSEDDRTIATGIGLLAQVEGTATSVYTTSIVDEFAGAERPVENVTDALEQAWRDATRNVTENETTESENVLRIEEGNDEEDLLPF